MLLHARAAARAARRRASRSRCSSRATSSSRCAALLERAPAAGARGAAAAAARRRAARRAAPSACSCSPPTPRCTVRWTSSTAALDAHPAVLVPRLTGRLPRRRQAARRRRPASTRARSTTSSWPCAATRRAARSSTWWPERAFEAAEAAAKLKAPPAMRRGSPRARSAPPSACFDGLGAARGRRLRRLLLEPARAAAGAAAGGELTAAGRPAAAAALGGLPARPAVVAVRARLAHARARRPGARPTLVRRARGGARAAPAGCGSTTSPCTPEELPNGLVYDARLQRLHAEAADAGEGFGDVFSPAGADAFADWLDRARAAGRRRRAQPLRLRRLEGARRRPRRLSRPRRRRRRGLPRLAVGARARGAGAAGARCCPRRRTGSSAPEQRVPAVLVAGYLRGTLGLGQAGARLHRRAAGGRRAGRDAHARDRPARRRPRRAGAAAPAGARVRGARAAGRREPEVNLLCVNADQTPELVEALGEEVARPLHDRARGRGRPTSSPSAGTRRSRSSTSCGSTRPTSPRTSRAPRDVPIVVMPLPGRGAGPRGRDGAVRAPGRLRLPVRLRLLLDARAQEPGRADRGVQAGVRARRGADAACSRRSTRDYRAQERERLRHAIGDRTDILLVDQSLEPARARGAVRARRLLRLAAPRRGLRAHARGVDGARQAGDRHGLLRPTRTS